MHTKRNLIIVVVIVVVLIVAGLLWRGGVFGSKEITTGEFTSQPGINEETDNQVAEKSSSFGKLTDDIFIEIIAQVMNYQSQKNPNTYALNIKNLYEKYGVTEANLNAYNNELSKDPVRTQAVVQKYTQRLMELQKTTQ